MRQNPYTNGHATREPSGEDATVHVVAPEEPQHDAPSSPPHVAVSPPEVAPPESQFQSEDSVGVVNVSVHAPPPPRAASPPPSPAPPRREVPPPAQVIVQDPNPELVKKLEEAQAEIERLRSLIASMPEPSVAPTSVTGATAMRHRRRAPAPASDDGSSVYDGRSDYDGRTEVGSYVGSEVAPPDGVPLQVVIIIALGVFVTTYLFF